MGLETQVAALAQKVKAQQEILQTEEAAKTALIMPFIQMLGYDVFNPQEVVPEFTCDVGTKKGEKVDYAICVDDAVRVLIECKPASAELSLKNASQLYRYFGATNARFAILTNGIIYKFYTDIDAANRMDEKPFHVLDLNHWRKQDVRTLEKFTKPNFDIDKIVREASTLKMQSLVAKTLEQELTEPSEDFVKFIAGKVHDGRVTSSIRETYHMLITTSFANLVRDKVNDRLNSAINAQSDGDNRSAEPDTNDDDIETTQAELDGYNIIRAIGSESVDVTRIVMRDAKSYCAVLLDDNNRKTIARLHFNSSTARYIGTFVGKTETRNPIEGITGLYSFRAEILARIKELDEA